MLFKLFNLHLKYLVTLIAVSIINYFDHTLHHFTLSADHALGAPSQIARAFSVVICDRPLELLRQLVDGPYLLKLADKVIGVVSVPASVVVLQLVVLAALI